MNDIFNGDRVMCYDGAKFKDDITTPCSMLFKPATVVCRYGFISREMMKMFNWSKETATYPDCCDVIFDDAPDKISHGHFTDGIERIV